MKIQRIRAKMLGVLVLFFGTGIAACNQDNSDTAGSQVEGLWLYTGLSTSDGSERPLSGIFLFKNGIFVQQAIFDGEPFEEQAAMAHAGPYTSEAESVHLVAEPTISISPLQNPPLSFQHATEHDVSVTRSGDSLTLVFGSGTVQEFRYIGPGNGEVYNLEGGALAFADDWFILVQGDETGTVSGYGKFARSGEDYTLDIIRWAEADSTSASYRRDVAMQATFDGRLLTLSDGRVFRQTD